LRVYNSLKINPSAEPTTSLGAHGPSVVQLQEALVNAGFDPQGVDGSFGPATKAALVAFQQAHGLTADGSAGPKTWRALAAAGNGTGGPSNVPASGKPTLELGATGDAVKALQEQLTRDGYSTGGVDGVFGRHTLAAVDAFQKRHGLSTDGVVGDQTWNALATATPRAPSTAPGPRPVSMPANGGPEPTLQSGASGPAVSQLQTLLTTAGFSTRGIDGSFGAATQGALMSYQYSRGLPVDGVAGPQTWAALSANTPQVRTNPVGAGTNANLIAQRFLGQAQHQLQFSGQLPEDRWVPQNVDCANFVSACLQMAGRLPASQHNNSVVGLKNNLLADGWREIPLSEAKPGDVACFDGPHGNYQHVELFDGWNGSQPRYIGSNNTLRDGTQAITHDTGAWAHRVHIFAPPA
jgi:peptidoglycan hydrolase-like protein with peptidoglycan-binding domain